MSWLPPRANLFLWVVILAALTVAVVSAGAARGDLAAALGLTTLADRLTTLAAIAGIVVAGLFPICLGNKIRTSVGSAMMFAAALLMAPLQVLIVVAPSVAIYTVINGRKGRWPLYYPVFNIAQNSLAAMATSILFHSLDTGTSLHLASVTAVANVGLAVLGFFIINSISVAIMSALFQGRAPWDVWVMMYRPAWPRSLSVLLLGVGMAVVYLQAPLGVFLFSIPLIVIHQAYSNAVAIQTQTKETLEVLADAIDKRDPYTYAHSQRVAEYARLTAKRLGLPENEQEAIALAARVHDLGKIGVRDALLRKPDRLTEDELEEVRRHTIIGAEIVSKLADYARGRDAILYHHERWDGSGVHRLAYDHIPIGARIIAVADAYDAMTSDRPYRRALPQEATLRELERSKGTQFDPVVVEAFIDAMRSLAAEALPVAPTEEPEVRAPRPVPVPQARH